MKHGTAPDASFGFSIALAACLLGTLAVSWWGQVQHEDVVQQRAANLVQQLKVEKRIQGDAYSLIAELPQG